MPEQSHLIQYHIAEPKTEAQRVYMLQRKAYLKNPYPSYEERIENLNKFESIFIDHEQEIIEAMAADYGHRPTGETLLIDLFFARGTFRDIRKHLKKWMKPQSRKISLFVGGKNKVIPQPKGVVGLIVPWNYPTAMVSSQAAISMAAGNRTVIKMAENSKHLRALFHKLIAEKFDEDYLAVVPDAGGSDFSSLPFDHMLFTGSPPTGKAVMSAAAENLCPVTLELGGKSPTIVADDYNLETAARRIAQYKFLNAGQTCLAPDYAFVPRNKVDEFVEHLKKAANDYFPNTNDPEGYASVIDESSYKRLVSWLEEATAEGAEAINLTGSELNETDRKIPPHVVINPKEETNILRHEIFGPLLPIIPYDSLDDVLEFIAVRDRPLALYLFSNDKATQERVIYASISGGVTINNCVVHAMQHHMPFGGVGASGLGHYHSWEGFNEFSKMRPVFWYPDALSSELMAPPYGNKHRKVFDWVNRLGL